MDMVKTLDVDRLWVKLFPSTAGIEYYYREAALHNNKLF